MTKEEFLRLESMLQSKNKDDVELGRELLNNLTLNIQPVNFIHFRYLWVLGGCEYKNHLIEGSELFKKCHVYTKTMIRPGYILDQFSLDKYPLE